MNTYEKLCRLIPTIYQPSANKFLGSLLQAWGKAGDNVEVAISEGSKQIFSETAENIYLDRIGANAGIERPKDMGMLDRDFRQLIPALSFAPKQIKQTITDVLEIFYGINSVYANITTTVEAPYALVDSYTIAFKVDNETTVTITFNTSDFASISAATALEVANAINKQALDLNLVAEEYVDNVSDKTYVRVRTLTVGSAGAIQTIGGYAQNILKFPEVRTITHGTTTEWDLAIYSGDIIRLEWTGVGLEPDLSPPQINDLLIISGPFDAFNEGTFIIENISIDATVDGVTPGLKYTGTYVEFRNTIAVDETVIQTSNLDVTFYYPYRSIVAELPLPAMLYEVNHKEVVIQMPSTSPIITRDLIGASHIHPSVDNEIVNLSHVVGVPTEMEDSLVGCDAMYLAFGGVGDFVIGDTLTGTTSLETATVSGIISNDIDDTILGVKSVSGGFTIGELITNNISSIYTYAHGVAPAGNPYVSGVYSPTQNRIYFVPYGQADEAQWHYIDCATGIVHAYTHGVTAVNCAYAYGVYSPTQNRIYFVPNFQANQTNWHYIDCATGIVHAYAHGVTVVSPGYYGGVYSPTQNRIYFVPNVQAPQVKWHYLDCATGAVVAYTHGVTAVLDAYYGGVYSPTQNRIYFIPYKQAPQINWHYINCTTGAVVAYAHGATAVLKAYYSGVYSPTQNRIYFAPLEQAPQVNWHYLDCATGVIVAYAHGVTAVLTAYAGAIYSPIENRIYFVPYAQGPETNWHYLDCATGAIVAYAHGVTAVLYAYADGTYSPIQNRIYFAPFSQAGETNWHYVGYYTRNLISLISSLGGSFKIDSILSMNSQVAIKDKVSSFTSGEILVGRTMFIGDESFGTFTPGEAITTRNALHLSIPFSGAFVLGETITGLTSTKTATVLGIMSNRWNKTTVLLISAPSGALTVGETIQGGTSTATGRMVRYVGKSSTTADLIDITSQSETIIQGNINNVNGLFINGEIIIGGTSGALAVMNIANTFLGIYESSVNLTDWLGTYVFDDSTPYAAHNVSGTINQNVYRGMSYSVLQCNLLSSDFLSEGYVVFDYGLSTEDGFVKYLAKPNSYSLVLDPSYKFKNDHTSGATIRLVTLGAPVIDTDGTDYPTYVTGLEEVLVILEAIIKGLVAAGIVVRLLVKYPPVRWECFDKVSTLQRGIPAGLLTTVYSPDDTMWFIFRSLALDTTEGLGFGSIDPSKFGGGKLNRL